LHHIRYNSPLLQEEDLHLLVIAKDVATKDLVTPEFRILRTNKIFFSFFCTPCSLGIFEIVN